MSGACDRRTRWRSRAFGDEIGTRGGRPGTVGDLFPPRRAAEPSASRHQRQAPRVLRQAHERRRETPLVCHRPEGTPRTPRRAAAASLANSVGGVRQITCRRRCCKANSQERPISILQERPSGVMTRYGARQDRSQLRFFADAEIGSDRAARVKSASHRGMGRTRRITFQC